jgi:hypothetical protein
MVMGGKEPFTRRRTGRVECLGRIVRVGWVQLARHVELEHDRVFVRGLGLFIVGKRLELARVHVERHEPEPVREHFVLDNGRVVPDVDVLDRHGRHLGQQNAAQCIRDRRIDANQIENDLVVAQTLDLDLDLLLELVHKVVARFRVHVRLHITETQFTVTTSTGTNESMLPKEPRRTRCGASTPTRMILEAVLLAMAASVCILWVL